MSVAGRHVVITGGGSGVGATLAEAMSAAGAKVTILGRRQAPLEAVAERTGASAVTADVTDRAGLYRALQTARDRNGPISIAIANAGQAPSAPFGQITAEDFAATLSVNLNGVFHLWQATAPEMRATGWGRLIAIASTAGLKGYPYVSPYCAAKHGVIGLTRALALELATSGITVNAICPGFIDTPLLERSIEAIAAKTGMSAEKAAKTLQSTNPQGRFVPATDVADAAVWLCSAGAGSVNGHSLTLSGGEI